MAHQPPAVVDPAPSARRGSGLPAELISLSDREFSMMQGGSVWSIIFVEHYLSNKVTKSEIAGFADLG